MPCFPFPSPTFHVPWPCHCFHDWRGWAAGGSWGAHTSLLKAGAFQSSCWWLLHLQSHRGKVWECPVTEQIHNKTHLWLTEFQMETQLSSMYPWSCQMVIMRKSAGNTSFLGLLNSSCACFSVLAFVNSQSTNVLGVFCTVCGQWQIYIQHWIVISIFSFFLGIVCTGKAKQQASLR